MTDRLLAAITNPALPAAMQDASTPTSAANILGVYIAVLWRTALTLGGLAVIIYLLVGGFYWITASGDKGKVEQAKERIMQAIIGFAVLAAAAAVSVFLGSVFGLDLLRPDFAVLSSSSGGNGGGGNGGGGGFCGSTPVGTVVSDGGAGGYCIGNPGSARVQCVGAGQGSSGFDYPHFEPCSCEDGTPDPGYTFSSC